MYPGKGYQGIIRYQITGLLNDGEGPQPKFARLPQNTASHCNKPRELKKWNEFSKHPSKKRLQYKSSVGKLAK